MDFAIAAPVGTVNPSIDSPHQTVCPQLLVAYTEPREQDPSFIRLPVTVRILEEQQVRCDGHQNASMPWKDSVRESELLGENGRCFIASVAVSVLEHPDAPCSGPDWVIDHLCDEQSSITVPGHRYRANDFRLGRHELND